MAGRSNMVASLCEPHGLLAWRQYFELACESWALRALSSRQESGQTQMYRLAHGESISAGRRSIVCGVHLRPKIGQSACVNAGRRSSVCARSRQGLQAGIANDSRGSTRELQIADHDPFELLIGVDGLSAASHSGIDDRRQVDSWRHDGTLAAKFERF